MRPARPGGDLGGHRAHGAPGDRDRPRPGDSGWRGLQRAGREAGRRPAGPRHLPGPPGPGYRLRSRTHGIGRARARSHPIHDPRRRGLARGPPLPRRDRSLQLAHRRGTPPGGGAPRQCTRTPRGGLRPTSREPSARRTAGTPRVRPVRRGGGRVVFTNFLRAAGLHPADRGAVPR